MLHGRQTVLPTDISLAKPSKLPHTIAEYKDELLESMETAQMNAIDKLKSAGHKTKQQYDKNTQTPNYEVEDKVTDQLSTEVTNEQSKVQQSPVQVNQMDKYDDRIRQQQVLTDGPEDEDTSEESEKKDQNAAESDDIEPNPDEPEKEGQEQENQNTGIAFVHNEEDVLKFTAGKPKRQRKIAAMSLSRIITLAVLMYMFLQIKCILLGSITNGPVVKSFAYLAFKFNLIPKSRLHLRNKKKEKEGKIREISMIIFRPPPEPPNENDSRGPLQETEQEQSLGGRKPLYPRLRILQTQDIESAAPKADI